MQLVELIVYNEKQEEVLKTSVVEIRDFLLASADKVKAIFISVLEKDSIW